MNSTTLNGTVMSITGASNLLPIGTSIVLFAILILGKSFFVHI